MPKYTHNDKCGPIDLAKTFVYHAPKDDQAARYTSNRDAAGVFARHLADNCPPSAELTLAIRAIQEAMMWSNAAIAIHE